MYTKLMSWYRKKGESRKEVLEDKKFKDAYAEYKQASKKAKDPVSSLKEEFPKWCMEVERKIKEYPEKLSPELRKEIAEGRFHKIAKQVNKPLDGVIFYGAIRLYN